MLYFANPVSPAVRAHMAAGTLGYIDTPGQGNARPPGVTWCADNGAYSDNWDETAWWAFLHNNADHAASCAFAVAPDVVGDAWRTHCRSLPWLSKIRALGYPVAYVAQDGIDRHPMMPWHDFDVLFLGGTTEFKLGPIARHYTAEAKAHGKLVHMGRVNSKRRFEYAKSIGCDSVDGTFLTYGPDKLLPELLSWIEPGLFELAQPPGYTIPAR